MNCRALGVVLLVLGFGSLSAHAQETNDAWLGRYHAALTRLAAPARRAFRERIQVVGWQEGISEGEFTFQESGGWEASITEIDRLYRLDGEKLRLVGESDRLGLYTEYVERPERVAPTAFIDLDATPDTYAVSATEAVSLDGRPARRLRLAPKSGGPLRELWLDPATALPRRVLLALAGVWGVADVTVDFAAVGPHWLPSRSRFQIAMNFWVPVGFSRRVFAGRLDIGNQFSDYRFGVDAPAVLSALPAAAARTPGRGGATEGSNALGGPLEVNLSTQQTRSPLAERIAQFNLHKPDLVDPRTRLNVFYELRMGGQRLLLYLFRFDARQPLVPIEAATPQGDAIKIFGTQP